MLILGVETAPDHFHGHVLFKGFVFAFGQVDPALRDLDLNGPLAELLMVPA